MNDVTVSSRSLYFQLLEAMAASSQMASEWLVAKNRIGKKLLSGRLKDLTDADYRWLAENDPRTIEYIRMFETPVEPYDEERCTASQVDYGVTGDTNPLGHNAWYWECVRNGTAADYREAAASLPPLSKPR